MVMPHGPERSESECCFEFLGCHRRFLTHRIDAEQTVLDHVPDKDDLRAVGDLLIGKVSHAEGRVLLEERHDAREFQRKRH